MKDTKYVSIKSGKYRNAKISGIFPLVKDVSFGKKGAFITVDASNQFAGLGNIRVLLNDVNNVEHVDPVVAEAQMGTTKAEKAETREDAITRIRRRFDILQEMTRAVIKGGAIPTMRPQRSGRQHNRQLHSASHVARNRS